MSIQKISKDTEKCARERECGRTGGEDPGRPMSDCRAVIMGTVLILILCGRVIFTSGIGEITGQAAESQAVGAAAAVDAAPRQKDNLGGTGRIR